MNIESIFIDSKWHIITEISRNPSSPSELARITGTSTANISSQLRLLEALELIQEEKLTNIAKGEPRKIYSLAKEFSYIVLASKCAIGKKMIKLNKEIMPLFAAWLLNDAEQSWLITKVYMENDSVIQEADSFGYLGLKDSVLEFLVLHPEPAKMISLNEKQVFHKEKTYKIKVHAYTREEFEKGIQENEAFSSLLKKVFLLIDKERVLCKLKRDIK